ncbi:maleylpyruvate isomerase family mycothiol-dependent enzyme [Paractinoplanes ferrugineus]|uniref:Maleylpyruvate isomerase n=1 Tax=Paractinoplanes ferrugineus TaxID=113564 RepID=A0A919JE96_9ACTN|nr:maleylpyruvate isomerase family mycothiol-dependent enzyme [Actinoplanes ferrugineus]GIE15561.1 maleylpyruvate isomerase [Actinoplanes ferrugineus]
MTMDPLVLLTDVDQATEALIRTASDLDPTVVSTPSLLPGWTVGHVLTHVARNADALTRLLTGARTGTAAGAYAPGQRAEEIEAGADRPLREQIADIRSSHDRFADACAAMPAEAWPFRLEFIGMSAAGIPWIRLREVEVHHVDLALGHTPADWSDAFALRLLKELVTGSRGPAMVLRPFGIEHALTIGDAAGAPVVSGPTKSIAAWLAGRGDGADLTVSPEGELPTPTRWT